MAAVWIVGLCPRCKRDARAGSGAYCRSCHAAMQVDERDLRRRELAALRALERAVSAYLEGSGSPSQLTGAAIRARELRPLRPWGGIR